MRLLVTLCVVALAALAVAAGGGKPRSRPAPPATQSNLDFWLDQAPVATAPTGKPAPPEGANPFGGQPANTFSRQDALPCAMQLSDGRLLAGWLYTTAGKDLQIWTEQEKRWRHVPLVCIMGIHAVVTHEGMERQWRWKEMGSDEKVYSGRRRPVRHTNWRLNLIDGTSLQGEIDGQPLWLQRDGKRSLWILHHRTKGKWGQKPQALLAPAHIVISRRQMERVAAILGQAAKTKVTPATRPSGKPGGADARTRPGS